MKERKDCFIILRVTKQIKSKIESISTKTGQSISEFVRDLIDNFFVTNGKRK